MTRRRDPFALGRPRSTPREGPVGSDPGDDRGDTAGALVDGTTAAVPLELDRLPLAAAADMLALDLGVGGTLGRPHELQLERVIGRLAHPGQGQDAEVGAAALVLLTALCDRACARGKLPSFASEAVAWLARQVLLRVDDPGGRSVSVPCEGLLTGPPQLSSALVGPVLEVCARVPEVEQAVCARLLRGEDGARWREHAVISGRDVLASTLVERAVARGDLDTAMRLARAWPPMRTALLALAAALKQAGRDTDLATLALPYHPGGALAAALSEVWQPPEGLPAPDEGP